MTKRFAPKPMAKGASVSARSKRVPKSGLGALSRDLSHVKTLSDAELDSSRTEEKLAKITIKLAKQGAGQANHFIIRDFVASLRSRSVPHPLIADYFADALDRILGGADPAKALGLRTSRVGRRQGSGRKDAAVIAAACRLLIQRGEPRDEAIQKVIEAVGVAPRTGKGIHERTVQRYLARYRDMPNNAELLEGLAGPLMAKIRK